MDVGHVAVDERLAQAGGLVFAVIAVAIGALGLVVLARPVRTSRSRAADVLTNLGCGAVVSCAWGGLTSTLQLVNVGLLSLTTGGHIILNPLLAAPTLFGVSWLIPAVLQPFPRPYGPIRRAYLDGPAEQGAAYRPKVKRGEVAQVCGMWGVAVLGTLIGPVQLVMEATSLTAPMYLFVPLQGPVMWEVARTFSPYQRWYGALLLLVALAAGGCSLGLEVWMR